MGLQENLQQEPVSELAIREPVTATTDETVRSTIERMREQQLGCAILVDEHRRPLGMLTERMLVQLLGDGKLQADEPVEKYVADHWPWVRLDDPIVTVLDAMQMNNTRFLCVVDAEDRLVGLTGQKGLMEYVADHFPSQVMVQRVGGKPYPTDREGA